MPTAVSTVVARTKLSQLMRRAHDHNQRFIVGHRGEPQVVIMGVNDYLSSIAPEPETLRAIRSASRIKGTNKLSILAIDREISLARKAKGA